MASVPVLTHTQLEQVALLLGTCAIGSEITRVLDGRDDYARTGMGVP